MLRRHARELSAAALAYAREALRTWEPNIADDLIRRYHRSPEQAKNLVAQAHNVSEDSDVESDDEGVVGPVGGVMNGPQPLGGATDDVDNDLSWDLDLPLVESDEDTDTDSDSGDDWDDRLDPARVVVDVHDEGDRSGEFRGRYPSWWGVNAERYAGRVPGHTRNCVAVLIAADRTPAAGGVTVQAGPDGPRTVGFLQESFHAEAVMASTAEVDAHMRGRQRSGWRGVVLLRGPVGMLHGVFAETGADGVVRYSDPQRGIMLDVVRRVSEQIYIVFLAFNVPCAFNF